MNLIQRMRYLMVAVIIATVPPTLAGTVTANFTSASTIPVTAASYTATGNDVAGNCVFNFSRRAVSAQDTTQIFQYSTDLSHWTDVMITSPTDSMVTLGSTDSNGVQTVTVTIPQGTNTKIFGRIKVTQP